ncbi:hypothetical protein P9250_30690 [Caballeronia sp. LP006]|uniref:hypothetical protein n=1 Tax=Caballeronia sp. LP006 TaxID=3038552 RepID=UPI0028588776|nr:hypothetical protein [Caballeronia sp. LP006]MDR5832235.1 hypothetical protein [Caballeronia sp. LP006]
MKIYSSDGQEMMTVTSFEREGSSLVVKGMIFGAMPMSAELRPEEARAALKLLDLKTLWLLLTIAFRRSKSEAPSVAAREGL